MGYGKALAVIHNRDAECYVVILLMKYPLQVPLNRFEYLTHHQTSHGFYLIEQEIILVLPEYAKLAQLTLYVALFEEIKQVESSYYNLTVFLNHLFLNLFGKYGHAPHFDFKMKIY